MRSFFKNKTNIFLLFILVLAGFLRLYRIGDYMTFLGDEGRDVIVVYNILHGHLTLLGPTASVGGFYFGPIYYYMMAPFLWLFNYNPVGPAVMVALLGTATVWLVYKLGSEFFTKAVGLLAAFFYSISPVVISYSRSSWNPNPVPFFSLLTMYFLYLGIKSTRKKWFLFSGISLGIAVELHFIVFFLGTVIAVFLFLQKFFLEKYTSRLRLLKTLLGEYSYILLGFFIGWLPYLGFELRHQLSNTRNIINFIFHSKDTGGNSHFIQTLSDVLFRIFGHLVTSFPITPEKFNKNIVTAWALYTLIAAAVSITVLLLQFYWSKPYSSKQRTTFLLIVWLVVGVGLFGFYKKMIYDYYFTFLFALPFWLVSNVIYLLFQKKTIIHKGAAAVVFLSLTALPLTGLPFLSQPNRQLFQTETIARFVLSKTDNKPFNFALITGGNSDHAYRYFFTVWGHPPTTIENPLNDTKRVSVTNQLLIVCESIPCYPLGNPLFEIAGFGRGEIEGHWNVSVVEVYKLGHYQGKK